MATNDFWRRLSRDLTDAEIEAGLYINPLFFWCAMLNVASGVGMTLAQARVTLNLATGNSAGDEFTDFVTSAQSLPGSGSAKRSLQRQVVTDLIATAVLAGRGVRLPSNQFLTGNLLRLYYKALITSEGGTPANTVAAP